MVLNKFETCLHKGAISKAVYQNYLYTACLTSSLAADFVLKPNQKAGQLFYFK
ncbi:hypothetical protein HDF22_005279 [Mucilaginibacter lappiensis]|uniref:Uncharacterized protein n=1 Tax=Mucilaginibacter lappiensis TaxID=354630 RepID=A0A841JQU2_9SPHI|nr:hypothetical protein [Mucilaginibacter lappiensis]